MGYFDITYIVFVLPAVIFVFIAQAKVNSTFRRFSQVAARRGFTGAQTAETLLRSAGVSDVKVEYVEGNLSDHFDPKTKVIRLSASVYSSTSVAAAGVAAHECGHAMQYAAKYFPIKIRTAIIPVSKLGSVLTMPLIIAGFIFSFQPLVNIGILFFAAAVLFELITLPVEFDASRRAIAALDDFGVLEPDENEMAKKVLTAAAMTYVAALAVSLAQLLRLIFLFGGRRRD